jgi:hypothetical protein
MILKAMGLMDFISGILIFFSFMMPRKVLLLVALYLLFKGFLFGYTGNIISWIDFMCGVYVFIIAFDVYLLILNIGFAIYLVQKSFFSLII